MKESERNKREIEREEKKILLQFAFSFALVPPTRAYTNKIVKSRILWNLEPLSPNQADRLFRNLFLKSYKASSFSYFIDPPQLFQLIHFYILPGLLNLHLFMVSDLSDMAM